MTMTVAALADQFYAYMEGRKAQRTIDYYRSFLCRFVAHVGEIRVSELKKHHLLLWAKTWHQQQAVQRLFEWARSEAELIARNPFKGIKLAKPKHRQRVLNAREFAKLLKGAKADFRRFLFAMRESIARPQEVRGVKWEWVRWDGGHQTMTAAIAAGDAYFELWAYKGKSQRSDPNTPRRILINARLGRLMVWLLRGRACPAGEVFVTSSGRRWTANAVRLRMKRLVRKLGIEKDERGEALVAYTLRHTAATNASAHGASDRVLAEIMGHTSTRMTQRYCHLSKAHLRQAMKGVWTFPNEGEAFPN